MLDLPTLTAVDHLSPYYNERGKTGIFYAQSWALIHMLNFAPEYRAGVANFVEMILGGEDAVNAFRQAFGKTPAGGDSGSEGVFGERQIRGFTFGSPKFDRRRLTPSR